MTVLAVKLSSCKVMTKLQIIVKINAQNNTRKEGGIVCKIKCYNVLCTAHIMQTISVTAEYIISVIL